MHWIIKYARFLLLLAPAVGLVMPAFAQARDPLLSDSQEAGSVIVFPKFIKGTVNPDGVATPRPRSRSASCARMVSPAPSTSR
jgi:hypothetical protein